MPKKVFILFATVGWGKTRKYDPVTSELPSLANYNKKIRKAIFLL